MAHVVTRLFTRTDEQRVDRKIRLVHEQRPGVHRVARCDALPLRRILAVQLALDVKHLAAHHVQHVRVGQVVVPGTIGARAAPNESDAGEITKGNVGNPASFVAKCVVR